MKLLFIQLSLFFFLMFNTITFSQQCSPYQGPVIDGAVTFYDAGANFGLNTQTISVISASANECTVLYTIKYNTNTQLFMRSPRSWGYNFNSRAKFTTSSFAQILPFTTFNSAIIEEFGGDFGDQDKFGYKFVTQEDIRFENTIPVFDYFNCGYQDLYAFGGVDNVVDEQTCTLIPTAGACNGVSGTTNIVAYGVPYGYLITPYQTLVPPTANFNIRDLDLLYHIKRKPFVENQSLNHAGESSTTTGNQFGNLACKTTCGTNANFAPVSPAAATVTFKVTFFK